MRVFLLLLVFIVETLTMEERNKIYTIKAEIEDQATSDTGYIYNADSTGPTKYIQYSDTSGSLTNLGYPTIPLNHYVNGGTLYPGEYYTHNSYATLPYKSDKGDSNYEKKDGQAYETEYRTRKGEKKQSGYNNIQEFDKGLRGIHENVDREGYYGEKGENKKNYMDESKHYNSKHDSTDGYKSDITKKSSDSKSGQKTTGYHKRFNKDEFKKKHTFYDESDKKGHYYKYGDYDSYHTNKNGERKSGAKGNSGYYQDYYGEKGEHDKGHYLDNDSKYKGQKGNGKYYKHYTDYAKQANNEDGKSYTYT